jgi:catechol 2,3-dioxygenase
MMDNYSLPDQTDIGFAHLRVGDLARSLQFYHDMLGLTVVEQEPGLAALSSSPDEPPILLLSEYNGAKPRPRRTAGLYHIAIRYPTRAALGWVLHRLGDHGWPVEGAADHGVSEALYMADPDGNGVELYRDRPREEWPHQGDQVAMATDPLDVKGVADAASGYQGDAAPKGTAMGHIHLQVSGLQPAREFYHDRLGLDITQESYPGAIFMSAGGYHHHLGTNIWAGNGIPPTPPDAPGLVSFALALPDAASRQKLADRLQAAGLHVERRDIPGWGDALQLEAPDGVLVDLVARRVS